MLTAHQLLLLPFVNAGVAVVGAVTIAYLLRLPPRGRVDDRGADPGDPGDSWRGEAIALAREVRSSATSFDRPADSDRVSRDLLPLSARIRGHVRSAPRTVDQGVYRRLFDLGIACQRVAIEPPSDDNRHGHQPIDERLEALESEAENVEERIEPIE